MTFEQWSERIVALVGGVLPGVRFRRNVDDMCRWTYAKKECQLHGLSPEDAQLIALREEGGVTTRSGDICRIRIERGSEEDVALRIVGFFAKQ